VTRLESLCVRAGATFTVCWFVTWCLGTPEPLFAWPAIACLTVAAWCNWRTDAHRPDPTPVPRHELAARCSHREHPVPCRDCPRTTPRMTWADDARCDIHTTTKGDT
jgi:hypothetical protein